MEKTNVKRLWVHRLKIPGKHLPKQIMRPFSLPVASHSLDEKQLALVAEGDKRNWVNMLRGFAYATTFGASGIVVISWLSGKVDQWSDFDVPIPEIAVIAFVLSILFKLIENKLQPTRFIIFDRNKGTVSFPLALTSGGGRATLPWCEMAGRLSLGPTVAGETHHLLILVHINTGQGPILDDWMFGIDHPLGVWSFIVQYMNKDGPLPDVTDLHHCANTTPGLGTWDAWEKGEGRQGQVDPYYEWLAELNEDPSLDEVNARIEAMRRA
jgi:hypothetical protein